MNEKQKVWIIRLSVIVAYALVIIINTLANALPINGIAANEVSDLYANLFAPAGIAFSIWGLIFLTLGAYCIYQLPVFQKQATIAKNELLNTVGMLFILSSIINVTWVFTWHYQLIWLSVILMALLLVVLLFIALTIQKYAKTQRLTITEQLALRLPFSLYVGWITVATIANVTTFLVSIGFTGFGLAESLWMVAILIVGALIGSVAAIRQKDFIYGLVIIWGYTGIIIQHTTTFESMYPEVIWTAAGAIGVLAIASIYACYREFFAKK